MMWFQNARLAQLARQQRLPAISMFVPFAEAGSMLAYGPDNPASAERCAALVAKILAGAKPGELPIERPTKFEFVVNRRTAKALRLTIPYAVLARADRRQHSREASLHCGIAFANWATSKDKTLLWNPDGLRDIWTDFRL
jgi:hypothetical protein